ncbi:carboxylating nicotinate-nucleotide diphosphorylase [Porphyromonas cangingivalis]|uniref:Probable nicotinate-nucleotide pyrophosphorylase [carboxylating] n=1 Tax=Porphyromonas cangingivalis TaxID=36874 RepID=A0A1T4MDT6_PORCN|nr:carboxylating nicotinate-nucleotide diphosphorylase [Porphyromonas cangingivalis]SJZ65051.1 nicotinate-nucleotide pyrophosphorylase [carboxylating] [Porphyromonas cangingivalis]VEJ03072.1 Probable nicotinate-nucleotide pyrophosphorylase [carboxylating] [Porphyromonas cangingivalis]
MTKNNSMFYQHVDRLITIAFEEDLFTGDLATDAIISKSKQVTAIMTAKADGVISGLEVAKMVIDKLGDNTFIPLVRDGEAVVKGQDIVKIIAPYAQLLSSERIMLNFLQRMSGIATMTARCVAKLEGTHARLLDTRKTLPGHRLTDKLAVRHGGGTNHRMGLYDMAMLKDNHIKAAGSITDAVRQAKQSLPISIQIEVETKDIDEVREALAVGADIIMLDNMSLEQMTEAVKLIDGRAKTEASGNITLETIAGVAQTGVDFISMGALTHSVKALDISMNFTDHPY